MDKLTVLLNEWDPHNLMSHAPDDEYELEIGRIKVILDTTNDVMELAKGIHTVFLDTCGSDLFKKGINECVSIAKKLLNTKHCNESE